MHRIGKQETLILLLIAIMLGVSAPGLYTGKVYAAASTIHTLVGEGVPEFGDMKVDVVDGNIMVSRYSYVAGEFKFVPQYVENEDHYSESAAVLKFGSDPEVLADTFVLGAGTSEWRNREESSYSYPYSVDQIISEDNRTVTTTWRLRPDDESHIEVVQRVTLPSKSAQYIDLEWEIKNIDPNITTSEAPRFLRGVNSAVGDDDDDGAGGILV